MSPTHSEVFEGIPIGYWVAGQRSRFRRGDLPDEHIKRLEKHEEWRWNPRDESWRNRLEKTKREVLDFENSLSKSAKEFIRRAQLVVEKEDTSIQKTDLLELLAIVKSRSELLESRALMKKMLLKEAKSLSQKKGFKEHVKAKDAVNADGKNLKLEARFEKKFREFQNYCEQFGTAVFERHDSQTPAEIKRFAERYRNLYSRQALSPDKIERFEKISGWRWSPVEVAWMEARERLVRWGLDTNSASPAHLTVFEGYDIGSWTLKQRAKYRRGKLELWKVTSLEQIPNWSWNSIGPSDQWTNSFEKLVEFVTINGTSDFSNVKEAVPRGITTFASHNRKSYREGTLTEQRKMMFEALPGWTWDPLENLWNKGYESLSEWQQRNPGLHPKMKKSVIDGFDVGAWAKRQKKAFLRNQLSLDQIRKLEKLSGWDWSV
jgi:hypothetical protein